MRDSCPVLAYVLDTRHVFTPYIKVNFNNVMSQLTEHGISKSDVWLLPGWTNLENSMSIFTDKEQVGEILKGLGINLTHPNLGEMCFNIESRADNQMNQRRPPRNGGYNIVSEEKKVILVENVVSVNARGNVEPEIVDVDKKKLSEEMGEKPDIKIIFQNCCYGELAKVPDGEFDKAMKKLLGIKLKFITEREVIEDGDGSKETGNRFCVLENTSIEKLSTKFDRFSVTCPETSKTYKIDVDFAGKLTVCRCCRDTHSSYCPYKNQYFQLKKHKEYLARRNEIRYHFFSDSQLRYVENIGLAANFTCCGGAKIGQIVNIIRDNPIIRFDTLIVVMGANNIDTTKTDEQFKLHTTIEVKRLFSALKLKRFNRLILIPGLRKTEDQSQKHQMYLFQDILVNETSTDKNISIYYVNNSKIDFDFDSEVHPSKKGTFDFLVDFAQDMNLDLFLNHNFAVTFPKKNIYSGVTSLYKFGCRFCEKTYFVRHGCCEDCEKKDYW